VTASYVVRPNATGEMRRQDDEWISMTLTSRGASREPYLKQVMFGEIPGKVARCSPASVLGVKRYEGT